jgi:hypothetical protein
VFNKVTVAPGITAPLLSVTRPWMLARLVCDQLLPVASNIKNNKTHVIEETDVVHNFKTLIVLTSSPVVVVLEPTVKHLLG